MTCERCGVELHLGDFPFCRRGPQDHARGVSVIIGDEMDHLQVNGTKTPIRFTSRQERKRWLNANDLVERDHHVPQPGKDSSPFTTDWSRSTDPQTAENVRILLERAFRDAKPEPVDEPLHIRWYKEDGNGYEDE